ncbi:MAG: tetratricopeptide repeat protein [Deltaproteobacteria bacterium]|nr:tetratricopeptide repeat protein [Deltaproteobacteria bacterium]
MRAFAATFVLLSLISVAPSWAEDSPEEDVRPLVEQAQRDYQEGRYTDAIRRLEAAYRLRKDARLLYNIARAHERSGSLEGASRYYREFLASDSKEPDLRAKARVRLEELDVNRTKTVEGPVGTPEVVGDLSPQAQNAAQPSASEGVDPASTPSAALSDATTETSPSSSFPLILAIGGGVVVAAGLGVGAWALATASSARSSDDSIQKPLLVDTARDRALAADVVVSVGLTTLLAGLLVSWLGS